METAREGFVIYKSFYEPIKDLSNEEMGELFRLIFEYQLSGEIEKLSEIKNPRVKMAFEFFKNQFRLDNQKYGNFVDLQREKGKRSAEKRWGVKETPKVTEVTAVRSVKSKVTEVTYKEKDKVKEKDKDKEKDINTDDFEIVDSNLKEIVDFYNEIFKKGIRSYKAFEKNFEYWAKIHPPDKIKKAIQVASIDKFWKDKMDLSILFRRKNPQGEYVDYIESLSNRDPTASKGDIAFL